MPKTTPEEGSFPVWSETQKYGVSYLAAGAEVEPHFHDCHEYWIIISGRGEATSEGQPYTLGPGDMLLTKAGDYHSVKVTQDMIAVYFYGVMPDTLYCSNMQATPPRPRSSPSSTASMLCPERYRRFGTGL
jgi:gentisate 1,2-dioxygenase